MAGPACPLRTGDRVTFTDSRSHVWLGVVTAVRGRIEVTWPDGVIGRFAHRPARALRRVQ
jgi:hypothetical protein